MLFALHRRSKRRELKLEKVAIKRNSASIWVKKIKLITNSKKAINSYRYGFQKKRRKKNWRKLNVKI
jgi:hypothetical protein